MAYYFCFLLLLGTMVYGLKNETDFDSKSSCSDGLVHGLLKQMVAEQIERQKILKAFEEVKNELSDVKQELADRNSQLLNTQFLQGKLDSRVKNIENNLKTSFIEEVKKQIISDENLMKVEINKTKEEIEEMKIESSAMFALLQRNMSDLQNKSRNDGPEIAFSVLLQSKLVTSSVIPFQHVITNIGGGYNTSDGIFYCPKAGLYMFTTTLVASVKSFVEGYLMKNNEVIARIHENIGHNYYPSSSLTAVLKLGIGDRVWVKGEGSVRYYTSDNSFTGVLIKQKIT